MRLRIKIRRSLTWLAHCYKAVFNNYHQQLLPLCQVILKQDDLVIDVGAQVGQLSKIFSNYVPLGRVLAVEPGNYPLSILRIVRFLHQLQTVKIIASAVGRQAGNATLQTPLKDSGVLRFGLSHLSSDEKYSEVGSVKTESVKITTVDKLVEQFANGHNFALLKADIEGHEYEMLCGATQSITSNKPCLLLEISNNRKEIMSFLSRHNYIVFALTNYGGKNKEPLRLFQIKEHTENQVRNVLAVNSSNQSVLDDIQKKFCQSD